MRLHRALRLSTFATAILLPATSIVAQPPATLGTIAFATSANAVAQPAFIRGMLLYYSFEYARAAEQFRDAQKADPSFALAYWGEALTYTHQVWNEQDLTAGRSALAKFAPTATERRAKVKTARERGYLDLAEALYGEGTKPARDTLFNLAAEQLALAYPAEDEPQVLNALGLLGLNQGVRDVASYMRAGAIAETILRHNPDHPAAAHFVIHAFDDPIHAPLGLWAARLYSKIAPAAPHAQHMTTHIFVALGMWDDVIAQNLVAAGPNPAAYHAGHYTWWLNYGFIQAGRYGEALKHLETMRANFAQRRNDREGPALAMMRAHYILDTERWSDPVVGWDFGASTQSPFSTPTDYFVRGFVALKRGDRARVDAALTDLAKLPHAPIGTSGESGGAPAVLEAELRGALLAADGKWTDAIAVLRTATAAEDAIPAEFGPPMIVKPSHELLGEILLAAGKSAEATTEFTRALSAAPGRSRSLIGLVRAASAAGNMVVARSAIAMLRANWHAADKDVPELAELGRLESMRH